METKVINLYGGPGCGKSTIAAGLYFKLKCLGIPCELTGEFAKERVWDDNKTVLTDQPYIFGQQNHRQRILVGKVKYIICDSPILLPIIYSTENSQHFEDLVIEQYNKYNNINFVLKRNDYKFEETGRAHNLKQSIEKDEEIKEKIFHKYNIPYININENTSTKAVNKIMKIIDGSIFLIK